MTTPADSPGYVSNGSDSTFYVRIGNTTQQLNIEQGVEYIGQRFRP